MKRGIAPSPCPSRKSAWRHRQDALRAARKVGGIRAVRLYVYRCPLCRQYHLSSQAPRTRPWLR